MAKTTHTTILCALAIVAALSHAHAADTLADMDIEVSPELQAMGIDPGVKHMAVNGKWQAVNTAGAAMLIALLGAAQQPGGEWILGDSVFSPKFASVPPGAIDLAVPGYTTTQILDIEVPQISPNARLVVVEGGTNNLLNPNTTANVPDDYAKIIAAVEARAPNARIEVVGVTQVDDAQLANNRDFGQFLSSKKVAEVNAQIAMHCTGRCSMVSVLPFKKVDGIHPQTPIVLANLPH